MINALLSEGGRQGARVTGAVGFSLQTGEVIVFQAKAVIISTGCPSGIWIFNTELCGGAAEFADPNCVGDGLAMAWKAGAQVTGMHKAGKVHGGGAFAWPATAWATATTPGFPAPWWTPTARKCPGGHQRQAG
jgi:succinate dehydrogenase/fumarate reductase flavoprotein subunit